MTERVDHFGFVAVFGNELSSLVVDSFGNSDKNLAVIVVIYFLDIRDEVFNVKIGLRQIDQIGTEAGVCRGCCACCKPARVTSHDLNDTDHRRIIHTCIEVQLHAGADDVASGGREAGAVVRAVQIVVDRLRNAHHAAFITDMLHVLADLVAGIHGIIAAVVEEVTDVVLLEDLKDALIIRFILFIVLQLITAGTECRGRGIQKQ